MFHKTLPSFPDSKHLSSCILVCTQGSVGRAYNSFSLNCCPQWSLCNWLMEWRSDCTAPVGLHSVSPGSGEGRLTWQDLSSASPSHCVRVSSSQSWKRPHLNGCSDCPKSSWSHQRLTRSHRLLRSQQKVPRCTCRAKVATNACSPLLALTILFLASEEILYFSTVLLQIFKRLKCFIWHNNLCCIKRFSLNIYSINLSLATEG